MLKANIPFSDVEFDEDTEVLETGSGSLRIDIPLKNEWSQYVEDDGYIVAPSDEGDFVEFRIQGFEERDLKVEIRAERSSNELNYSFVEPYDFKNLTAKDYLAHYLQKTRWQPGIVESIENRSISNKKYPSVVASNLSLSKEFQLEIRYRVVKEGSTIVARYVDLLKRRGKRTGKEFEAKKDIVSLAVKYSSEETYTAMYGIGKTDVNENHVNFKEVEWRTTNGDPVNKPLGQSYVASEEALAIWGIPYQGDKLHKFGKHEIQSDDPEVILRETHEKLMRNIFSKVTYSMDVAVLSNILGYEHEKVALGDTVGVKNPDILNMVGEARIIERTISRSNRAKDRVLLGEFREIKPSESLLVKQLRSELQRKSGKLDGLEGKVINDFATLDNKLVDFKTEVNGSFADGILEEAEAKSIEKYLNSLRTEKAAVDSRYNQLLTNPHLSQETKDILALKKVDLDYSHQILLGSVTDAIADGRASAEEKLSVDQDFDTYRNHLAALSLEIEKAQAEIGAAHEAAAVNQANSFTSDQLTNFVDATTYIQKINELQGQIDNQIETYFYDYDPTLSNDPTNSWTTDDEKLKHIGDLFFNKQTGYSYRFALDNGIYKWILVRDEGIAKAMADAANAQDTADSKRRVFVSQPTTPYDAGDLWDNDGAVYRSTVAKTSAATFSAVDWVKIGDVTSQNTAADTSKVGGTSATIVRDNANAGKSARDKIDTDVGTETIETETGAQAKANAARDDAKGHADVVSQKSYNEALANAKLYADENATMLGQDYNGVSITNEDGFVTARGDQLVRTVQNSTDGYLVQRRSSINDSWESVIYFDTTGKAYFAGNLEAANGTFSGDLIADDVVSGSGTTNYASLNLNTIFNSDGTSPGYVTLQALAMDPAGSKRVEAELGIKQLLTDRGSFLSAIDVLHLHAKELVQYGTFKPERVQTSELNSSTGLIRSNAVFEQPLPINPTLQNGWGFYGAPYDGARYRKDINGFIHLSGLVKSGTVGAYTPIFTLPTGYRPSKRMMFPVITSSGVGRLDIDPDGTVCLASGGNGFVSFNGVNFIP
jgi:phage minor structural protein